MDFKSKITQHKLFDYFILSIIGYYTFFIIPINIVFIVVTTKAYLLNNDNLLKDHEMRNKCIPWMVKNDIDLMIQVDADEFYSTREANNLIQFITDNSEHTIYNTIFKNVVGDGEIEDWSRFSAGWIKKHGGIKEYYFDMHWWFNDDFDYRKQGVIEIPKELVNPYHYTWTNDMNTTGPGSISAKIEYQNKIYPEGCGWEIDSNTKKIIKK